MRWQEFPAFRRTRGGELARVSSGSVLGDVLNGRVAIVTGAGAGIGLAIARSFADAGAIVVVADFDQEAGQAAAEEVGGVFLRTDVSDPTQITATVDAVTARFGRLDVLVNNAGIARYVDLFDLTVDDWDAINAVNARGTFLFLQAAARVMVAQGSGSIVNISSIAGKGYRRTSSVAYAAAKGAVVTMTRTTAARLGPSNVRVNCICPGVTLTPMVERWRQSNPEGSREVIEAIPLARPNQVEDVANLALFLASDLADTVTGQSWNVDGGLVND